MVLKKGLTISIITGLIISIVASLSLLTLQVRSAPTAGVYDPWIDTNDDGVINYLDLYNLAVVYGTSGTPINKTDLLLELEARIASLETKVSALNSTTILLNASITSLKTRVDALEAAKCIVKYKNIGSSSDIPTTARNLGSVTLSVPTNGYVILTVTATAVTFGDNTALHLGLGTTPGSFDLHETWVGVLDGAGTQRREFSATSLAVVYVTPGSHTFYATALKPSVFSAQTVNLAKIYMTAVFYGT